MLVVRRRQYDNIDNCMEELRLIKLTENCANGNFHLFSHNAVSMADGKFSTPVKY